MGPPIVHGPRRLENGLCIPPVRRNEPARGFSDDQPDRLRDTRPGGSGGLGGIEIQRNDFRGTSHGQPTTVFALSGTVRFGESLGRSEEHTSELQSLAYLVCRLLLEKKNARRTLGTFAYQTGTLAFLSFNHRYTQPERTPAPPCVCRYSPPDEPFRRFFFF